MTVAASVVTVVVVRTVAVVQIAIHVHVVIVATVTTATFATADLVVQHKDATYVQQVADQTVKQELAETAAQKLA